jgi:hypothetical protein
MRHIRSEVALAQRLHRLDDGGDPVGDVADQDETDGCAGDDDKTQQRREHGQRPRVIIRGLGGRLVGAGVVEVDVLAQDAVGVGQDPVDGLGVQFMRLARDLAGGLAGQRHHLLDALLVLFKSPGPLGVERAFFRGRDQLLIGLAGFCDAVDVRGQRLLDLQLVLKRFRQEMLAQDVAIHDDVRLQVAKHPDARQPVGRDIDRVGVDRPHVLHREQAHADHCNEQDGDDRDDLRADRIFGEHGSNLWFCERFGALSWQRCRQAKRRPSGSGPGAAR